MLRVTSTHFQPWVCTALDKVTYTEPSADQAQTVSRRAERFAELMQSVWVSRNDYERRVRRTVSRTIKVSIGQQQYSDVPRHSPSTNSWGLGFSGLSQHLQRNETVSKSWEQKVRKSVSVGLELFGKHRFRHFFATGSAHNVPGRHWIIP